MNDTLRALVDLRDRTLQKSRIAFGNRLFAITSGVDQASQDGKEIVERWQTRFDDLEKEADEDIRVLVQDVEIISYMCDVKGIGPMLAAKIVSMIDIARAPHISSLWKYAGYAVKDGAREYPKKGEKIPYNKRLKTTCYLVGTSFLRSNSPYRQIYDNARDYYELNRPDWTKAHRHQAAMRKMIKLWLSHLWLVWRTLESLPVSEPYVHEKLGHEHILTPSEFGWPEVAALKK